MLGIIVWVAVLKRRGVFLWEIMPADDVVYDVPRKKRK